jgi:hypothetical protein
MTTDEKLDAILARLDTLQTMLGVLTQQIEWLEDRMHTEVSEINATISTAAAEILDAERRRDLNESRASLRAAR